MSDNITLPREVVEEALETLEISVTACFTEYDHGEVLSDPKHFVNQAITALRTALAAEPPKQHSGYVIGNHWLETAYERVCAGEAEADVLRDCGWQRVDAALRREDVP